MITRIFRVRVPEHLHHEFEMKFSTISVNAVTSQPGLISVSLGKPTAWTPDEYVMMTTWEDEQSLREFAGENWSQAVIPEGMEKFVMECWVHHYQMLEINENDCNQKSRA